MKPDTPTNKLPSYLAMAELVKSIKEVSVLLTKERYKEASGEFKTGIADDSSGWMAGLKINGNGAVEKTIGNISLILDNDPLLKNKIALDDFACRGVALGALPWNAGDEKGNGMIQMTQVLGGTLKACTESRVRIRYTMQPLCVPTSTLLTVLKTI